MPFLSNSPLTRFFLLVLLWLPIWFVLWYFTARSLCTPAIWLASLAINVFHPGLLEDYQWAGHLVIFFTDVQVQVPNAPPGAVGQFVLEVNPLSYAWNLPALLALLFATDERFFSVGKLFLVFVLLLPLHAWGIGFDILKVLALQAGPEGAVRLGYSGWSLEFIALAYQFGYLMLPAIGAGSLWLGLNQPMIENLLKKK